MYRVNQAKEILHRSLTERRLELEVALRLADSRANLTGGSPAAAAQSDAKHR
jgi:hypothetical protein